MNHPIVTGKLYRLKTTMVVLYSEQPTLKVFKPPTIAKIKFNGCFVILEIKEYLKNLVVVKVLSPRGTGWVKLWSTWQEIERVQ